MDSLLLTRPDVNEIAAPAPARGSEIEGRGQTSTSWDGTWQHARVNQGDAAAWALVVFFLVTLGVVAGCVAAALTRPRGPRPEHLLIDEVLGDEDRLAGSIPGVADGSAEW